MLCVTHLLGQDVGNATYYHHRFEGHRMSNGDKYYKDSMTCAHRTYPFGTLLKVRNPRNEKEVIVKVTDRGPFNRRLMIDLSYRAAEIVGIIRRGIAPVEVTPFKPVALPFRADEKLPIYYLSQFSAPKEDFPLPPFKH